MSSIDFSNLGSYYRNLIENIVKQVEEKTKKAVDDAIVDTLTEFSPVLKERLMEKYREAIEDFYNDGINAGVEAGKEGSLYDLLSIDESQSVSSKGLNISMSITNTLMKPSWHNVGFSYGSIGQVEGYPEDVFNATFIEGYHGGRGATHTWWGFATATKTTPPNELFDLKMEEYGETEIQNDWDVIWNPIIDKYLDNIVYDIKI